MCLTTSCCSMRALSQSGAPNGRFLQLDTCFGQTVKSLCCGRVKEVCEGQKQIPFALELETGKWCVQGTAGLVSWLLC